MQECYINDMLVSGGDNWTLSVKIKELSLNKMINIKTSWPTNAQHEYVYTYSCT